MPQNSYTVKEMLQEVRTDNKQALETQASILTTLKGIDEHLGTLNSKVATHEKMIGELGTEHTKFKAVWATLATVAGFVWAGFEFLWN